MALGRTNLLKDWGWLGRARQLLGWFGDERRDWPIRHVPWLAWLSLPDVAILLFDNWLCRRSQGWLAGLANGGRLWRRRRHAG